MNIHAHGNENNPLVPSPGITYNFDIKVNSEGPQGSAEVTVTGKHDRFPGYEIIVQRIARMRMMGSKGSDWKIST